jgi:hypothetical protein
VPTKKQRRRQQKSRRHEYEYIYVDDEGNEVAVDPNELRTEKDEEREPRPKRGTAGKAEPRRGPGRAIEPPSWRKSGKRALILGPILIVAMMLFNQNVPLSQQIAPAIFLIAFFIPFSYFTDSLAYRMYRRRLERRGAKAR